MDSLRTGLQLFGAVCWHAADGACTAFVGERRFQLLTLLAIDGGWKARDEVAEWLWPERAPSAARSNLRKTLLQARELVALLAGAPPLQQQGDRLRWAPATDLQCFERACDACDACGESRDVHDAARAVRLYRPGLLDHLDACLVEAKLGEAARERLARQRARVEERWRIHARRWLAALHTEPLAQAAAAEELLAIDPLQEAALRTLLDACVASGELARGLRALQAYAKRLQMELQAQPADDLQAMAQRLRAVAAPQIVARPHALQQRAVDAVIEATLDTVLDGAEWPRLLQRLTEATGAIGSMVACHAPQRPREGLLLTHGLDPAMTERYLARYQDNPWSRAMHDVPAGRAVDQTRLLPRGVIERTEFHHDIVRPQNIEAVVATCVPQIEPFQASGVALCFGGTTAQQRTAQAIALLEHAAPYLQRAVASVVRQRDASHRHALLEAALMQLPGALCVLSADARLLFANAAADALLSAADGLCLRQGRLAAAHAADAPAFDAALREAALAPAVRLSSMRAELWLRRAGGMAPLRVAIAPLHDSDDRLRLCRSAAVLVTVDAVDAADSTAITTASATADAG